MADTVSQALKKRWEEEGPSNYVVDDIASSTIPVALPQGFCLLLGLNLVAKVSDHLVVSSCVVKQEHFVI